MVINRPSGNSQDSHSMRSFEPSNASTAKDTTSLDAEINALKYLDQSLRLAAQFHLGGLHASSEQLCLIVKKLKQFATNELEKGDGRKVESVRVERKLDGSVAVFFGV